jgi:AraC-like DNA-binding protein
VLVDHERLAKARALLVDDGASIAIAARAAGISRYHFIRIFEAVFGDTPHGYRTGVRIDRAKHLLASGRSVTETCMELGFSSVGSFSTLFRRTTGVSPSRYAHRDVGCLDLMAIAFRNSEEAPAGEPRDASRPC